MTAPAVIQMVADHADSEAAACDTEAADLEARAAALRTKAEVLRALHAIAAPHARPTKMDRQPVRLLQEEVAA